MHSPKRVERLVESSEVEVIISCSVIGLGAIIARGNYDLECTF